MKCLKIVGFLLLWTLAGIPAGFALTPVEDSSEDIYWSAPMTVHDYDKNTDLHNIALSTVSVTELEFLKLGDDLINFTTRSNKSPIARSLDSLEYAYSKLPQLKSVQWFGQFWDALQLRQLSLSDARVLSLFLFTADPYGGATSMMRVRADKLIIFVEDTVHGIDNTLMLPFNWGLSSLRDKPTKIKSLGYVADGLGVLRRGVFQSLDYVNNKLTLFGSDILFGVKKIQDTLIRHKRKKEHGRLPIYAKMPLAIFEKNRSHFKSKKKNAFAGTVPEWQARLLYDPELLPDDIQPADFPLLENFPTQSSSQEVIVATEYTLWEKVPRELKRYVITPDEVAELVRP